MTRLLFCGRELAFPTCDDHAGQTVSENIDGGAAHIHELVNAEEEKERLGRQMKLAAAARTITRDARATPAVPLLLMSNVSSMITCWPIVR